MTTHRPLLRSALLAALAGAWALAVAPLQGCSDNKHADNVVRTSDPARIGDAYDLILAAQDAERRKKYDDAVGLYRQGLEKYREFPAAWNNLGVLLMEQGRYLEAVECFQAAADLAPKDPRPQYNWGLAWEHAGWLSDAFEHYDLAIDRDGQYLPALRGAIRAERLLGRGSQLTLDRMKVALLMEQDAKWRDWMELQRLRLETELAHPSGGGKPRTSLPPPPAAR